MKIPINLVLNKKNFNLFIIIVVKDFEKNFFPFFSKNILLLDVLNLKYIEI